MAAAAGAVHILITISGPQRSVYRQQITRRKDYYDTMQIGAVEVVWLNVLLLQTNFSSNKISQSDSPCCCEM